LSRFPLSGASFRAPFDAHAERARSALAVAASSVSRWYRRLPDLAEKRLPRLELNGLGALKLGARGIYAFGGGAKNIKYVWLAAALLVGLNAAVLFSPMFFPKAVSGAEAVVGPATAELVSALNQSGLNASMAGGISKDHFSVQGVVVTTAGDNIQVFEYPRAGLAVREAEAFLENHAIAKASTPGAWQRPVSLYVKGALVIFYMGPNERIVKILDAAAGPALLGGMPAFGPGI
jgi:hypothetical protein